MEERRTITAGTMSMPQLVKKTMPHMNDNQTKINAIVDLGTEGCGAMGSLGSGNGGSSAISCVTRIAGSATMGHPIRIMMTILKNGESLLQFEGLNLDFFLMTCPLISMLMSSSQSKSESSLFMACRGGTKSFIAASSCFMIRSMSILVDPASGGVVAVGVKDAMVAAGLCGWDMFENENWGTLRAGGG